MLAPANSTEKRIRLENQDQRDNHDLQIFDVDAIRDKRFEYKSEVPMSFDMTRITSQQRAFR